ncbi:MAG: alpha-mannosidase, partial [Clostridia bacterium]|nr:alpha-mannosidase [Clostridia bacterium]
RFTGKVPVSAAGRDVVLLIDVNGEGCIVDKNGVPVLGITNKASDFDRNHGEPGKRVCPLFLPAKGGEEIDVWMDAGLNDLFGNLHDNGVIKEADIAVRNNAILSLYYDVEVLEEMSRVLPQDRARTCLIREKLYEVATRVTEWTEEAALWAKEVLRPCLEAKGGDSALTLSAIGHSHLDLAWLWPLRETKRKGMRTFATVMHYFDLYPEYQFVQSQAQLYDWIKELQPALYAKVKRKAAEGRWEPNGAMWVEPDCNMPCGESFVRQFLYGQKFFKQEFGRYCDVCFLPDTFGYSAALPQIIKGAGVKYFTTQKMSWNSVNRFPYQSFTWQGMDGSDVLAHMLPEQNYLSSAMPRAIKMNEENYYEKGKSSHALMLFGIGDGGGGPSEEHLERIKRQKNLPGQIPIVQETTSQFFKKLETEQDRLPRWVGEMYLEYHQGTLTTQARSKKWNRKTELGLRDAELISAAAETLGGPGYPAEELEKVWKEALLYQFHDILPGSSIG